MEVLVAEMVLMILMLKERILVVLEVEALLGMEDHCQTRFEQPA